MMFAMGPTPDQELLDSRSDYVSFEAAVGAWHAGYGDGRNGKPFHIFPSDAEELQPLYADGFERGERDDLHIKRITERVPRTSSGEPKYEPSPHLRLQAALDSAQNLHGHMLENSQLINAGAVALIAVALLIRRSSR